MQSSLSDVQSLPSHDISQGPLCCTRWDEESYTSGGRLLDPTLVRFLQDQIESQGPPTLQVSRTGNQQLADCQSQPQDSSKLVQNSGAALRLELTISELCMLRDHKKHYCVTVWDTVKL